jgi:hypothetical protein
MPFHLDLLGTLFMLWGVLTMLIGASTLALGIAAAALAASAAQTGNGGEFAAGLTAATFTALAVLALVWGLIHIIVGRQLRKRRHWSRLGALVLGSVDLLLLPYGTALGVYALWILLRERVKPLFEPAIVERPAAGI